MPVVRLLSSDASQKQRSAKQARHGSGCLLNLGEFVCEPSAAHRGGKIGVLGEWFAATSSPRLTRRRGTKWGDAAKPSNGVCCISSADTSLMTSSEDDVILRFKIPFEFPLETGKESRSPLPLFSLRFPLLPRESAGRKCIRNSLFFFLFSPAKEVARRAHEPAPNSSS